MKKLVSLVCASFMGACAVTNSCAETQPADAERYGPYPTNYKEIVMKWLDKQLIEDKPVYGYLVNFKVNARNRFGAYTGSQSHGALIYNGEVVKGLGFGY
jgi:hypothetical protein